MHRRDCAFALILLLLWSVSLPAAAADSSTKMSSQLDRALASGEPLDGDGRLNIWVRFTDKNQEGANLQAALDQVENDLAPKARQRRLLTFGQVADVADLPVAASYVDGVAATGAVLRHTSRWLNAASFTVEPSVIDRIADLPYVTGIDLVGRRSPDQTRMDRAALEANRITDPSPAASKSFSDLDYGFSGAGLEQINVPPLHDSGLSGEGVVIAIFDTGFELEHESIRDIQVVSAYDFVDDDPIVSPEGHDPVEMADHGNIMLSVMMGFSRGNLIGPAYGASAILARTEDIESETQAEEDNWIAALEWAEGLGADLVCSGIGYYDWYSFNDLDGTTTAITVAAEMAAARGVSVVNSAGNERNNVNWPYIIPPADGPMVVAVGSVDPQGLVAQFSSAGPTADGRIKPDVMVQGQKVVTALPYVDGIYLYGNGSDLAAATASGVVALMLEKNRQLTPHQVGTALRNTASRTLQPDNDYGWGTVDAAAAANYWSPTVVHTPLGETQTTNGPFTISAEITCGLPLDPQALSLVWRKNGLNWNREYLVSAGGDSFTATIPTQSMGTQLEYYISAGNELGLTTTSPLGAPAEVYAFVLGPDTEAPLMTHFRLSDQSAASWPPTITVTATDNVAVDRVEIDINIDGGPSFGMMPLVPIGDNRYSLEFPIPVGAIYPGQTVNYSLLAWDTATIPQVTFQGPFSFQFGFDRGRVLLIDDRLETEASLAWIDAWNLRRPAATDKTTGPDLAQWLIDGGWAVDVILAEDVELNSLQGYDAVFMTCGRNGGPLAFQSLRNALLNWNAAGGRILIEGGELAYAAETVPSLAEIKTEILHIVSWAADEGRDLAIPPLLVDHPFHHRPNELPQAYRFGIDGPSAYTYSDVVWPDDQVSVLLKSTYGTYMGGILAFDDNTGLDRGQTVYLSVDLGQLNESVGRPLLQNAINYLTGSEEPGPSAISGQVTLAGQTDFSGVFVSCGPDFQTITGPDGTFSFEGLWGGHYDITAMKTGYAPSVRQRHLQDGQEMDDVEFYLIPTVEVVATETPDLPIPDNDPEGITSLIYLANPGQVGDIAVNIDISHYSIGHLVVTLTSPQGTTVTLHNQNGGTADDLVGTWPDDLYVTGPGKLEDFLNEPAAGAWFLNVADVSFGALGRLNSWGLELQVTAQGVTAVDAALPPVTRLVGNVPNPFNPRTMVNFELAAPGAVRLAIYDIRGRLVARLADGPFPAGPHAVAWEGLDQAGAPVASGIYFARLETLTGSQVHKMTLVQ